MRFLAGLSKPNIDKLQSRRNIKGLIKALHYKEPAVRQATAEALGNIGDGGAVEPLIQALKDDNENVRTGAASALEKIGNPRAVEALIEALERNDNQLRRRAAEALVRVGTAAIEPLIALLTDSTRGYKARSKAASILGQIGDARTVEPLIAALKHHHQSLRQAAAEALGRIADPRAAEPLIGALDEEDTLLCFLAAEALQKIGDSRAVEPLIKSLDDGDCDTGWRAASALGKTGDPRAVEPLIEALDQEDAFLCLTAAEALGKIGDPRAIEPLIALHCKATDHLVRDQASESLKQCGYQASCAPSDELSELKKWLDRSLDAEIFVRCAKSLGFSVTGKGLASSHMESSIAHLTLALLPSIHPTNIATLVYTSTGAEHSITLVDEGKRKY
jgi:HEAT repeat protein